MAFADPRALFAEDDCLAEENRLLHRQSDVLKWIIDCVPRDKVPESRARLDMFVAEKRAVDEQLEINTVIREAIDSRINTLLLHGGGGRVDPEPYLSFEPGDLVPVIDPNYAIVSSAHDQLDRALNQVNAEFLRASQIHAKALEKYNALADERAAIQSKIGSLQSFHAPLPARAIMDPVTPAQMSISHFSPKNGETSEEHPVLLQNCWVEKKLGPIYTADEHSDDRPGDSETAFRVA